jgi:hypothetical protein
LMSRNTSFKIIHSHVMRLKNLKGLISNLDMHQQTNIWEYWDMSIGLIIMKLVYTSITYGWLLFAPHP